MLAPVTHILPITTIRRERVLPVPGKVLVRKGQRVNPTDVIAEAGFSAEHLLLDVARTFGISADRAEQLIQCKVGDQVVEGDLLAGPVGLMRRVMRFPKSGKVLLILNGQVLIEVSGQSLQLRAGLPGEIYELIADRGAIVETSGALIQGVWGNGRVDFGLLVALAKSPGDVLTVDQMDISLRGTVVLGGYCDNVTVLETAETLPLRGLILGSMSPDLILPATKIGFPIILLEGFGRRPINSLAYRLLTSNERRETTLNAEPWDRYKGIRPEIIIPLPASSNTSAPHPVDNYAPNKQVRILRAPFAGQIGTIVSLKGKMVFQNGLRLHAAEVRLEDGKSVLLPLPNLEILA